MLGVDLPVFSISEATAIRETARTIVTNRSALGLEIRSSVADLQSSYTALAAAISSFSKGNRPLNQEQVIAGKRDGPFSGHRASTKNADSGSVYTNTNKSGNAVARQFRSKTQSGAVQLTKASIARLAQEINRFLSLRYNLSVYDQGGEEN